MATPHRPSRSADRLRTGKRPPRVHRRRSSATAAVDVRLRRAQIARSGPQHHVLTPHAQADPAHTPAVLRRWGVAVSHGTPVPQEHD